jgi:hypothetical protein
MKNSSRNVQAIPGERCKQVSPDNFLTLRLDAFFAQEFDRFFL